MRKSLDTLVSRLCGERIGCHSVLLLSTRHLHRFLASPSVNFVGAAPPMVLQNNRRTVVTPPPLSSTTAGKPSERSQWVCPECGKRFIGEKNLKRHRRQRHFVDFPSEVDEARGVLMAENNALTEELKMLEERVTDLKQAIHAGGNGKAIVSGGAEEVFFSPMVLAAPGGRSTVRCDAPTLRSLRSVQRGRQFAGTGISLFSGVGRVVEQPQLGWLEGELDGESRGPPSLLQFKLLVQGHRERRPGQQQLYRFKILVRHFFSSPDALGIQSSQRMKSNIFTVHKGDVLRVEGEYRLHRSYDVVTKRWVENPCIEALHLGLLSRKNGLDDSHVDTDNLQHKAEVKRRELEKDGESITGGKNSASPLHAQLSSDAPAEHRNATSTSESASTVKKTKISRPRSIQRKNSR